MIALSWVQRLAHLQPVLSTVGITVAAALVLTGMSEGIGPTSPCIVRGGLPDAHCTPGEHYGELNPTDLCATGYLERLRYANRVSTSAKEQIFADYGRPVSDEWMLNRLIPLSLGGTAGQRNLMPLPVSDAARKARLEATLHADVCGGKLTLSEAQQMIAKDWVAAYRRQVEDRHR